MDLKSPDFINTKKIHPIIIIKFILDNIRVSALKIFSFSIKRKMIYKTKPIKNS